MPSGYTYAGQALSGIGGDIREFGNEQERLRDRIAQMAALRAAKIEEENRHKEDLALKQSAEKRAQADEDRKAQADKDQRDFMADVAKGKPGEALKAPTNPDSTWDGSNPNGPVISAAEIPSTPLNRDEIIQKALQKGVLPLDKFVEYTKVKEPTAPTGDLGEYALWVKEGNKGGFLDFQKAKTQATNRPKDSTGRIESTYITRFSHDQDNYEKKINPFVNLIQLKQAPSWGTGAGDISLINQLSLAEFGGYKPSDAEYNQFLHRMGLKEKAEQVMGSLESGQALAPEVRERMAREIEDVSKKAHTNFKRTIEQHKNRVRAKGIDPDEVVAPNGTYLDMEDYFNNKQPPITAKEGDTKKNSHGDNLIFKEGKWQLQP